jgi:hypothetical protein
MSPYNRVGAIVSLIALGLLASFALPWPALDAKLWAGSFTLSGRTLLGVLLCGLACAGADVLVTAHPRLQPQQSRRTFGHWILPAALTAAAWAWLARPNPFETRILGTVVASALLAALLFAEYYAVEPAAHWRSLVQFALNLFGYLLAMAIYLAVRLNVGTTWALPAVAVTSAGIGLRLLMDEESHLQRVWPYALGLGLLLALLSWVLGVWVSSPLLYSLLLAIWLYILVNMVRQFLSGKLTRWIAVEYVFVGLLALSLVLFYLR